METSAAAPPAESATTARPAARRPRADAVTRHRFAAPVAVYLAAHVLLMGVVWLLLARAHFAIFTQLEAGDGGWYAAVASQGYEQHLVWLRPGVPAQMRIEFFPLYPLVMRMAADVMWFGPAAAGLLISAVASLFAAAGIYAVVSRYASDATALATVGLWAVLPTAFFESMAYTEALFTALAAWAMYALLRSRWLAAAGLTILAGLTRPDSVTLIAVVCLGCLAGAIRGRGRWRAVAAMLAAPAGFAGYLLYIGRREHNARAWFISTRAPGWDSYFDFGRYTVRMAGSVLLAGNRFDPHAVTTDIVALFTVAAIAAACVIGLDGRVPLELRAWTWLGVLFTLGAANMWVPMPRFLLPFFPLLVPAAGAFVRASRRSQVAVAAAIVLLSAWWGAYFLQTPGIGLLAAHARVPRRATLPRCPRGCADPIT